MAKYTNLRVTQETADLVRQVQAYRTLAQNRATVDVLVSEWALRDLQTEVRANDEWRESELRRAEMPQRVDFDLDSDPDRDWLRDARNK